MDACAARASSRARVFIRRRTAGGPGRVGRGAKTVGGGRCGVGGVTA
jgi:hypothetical protein